MNKSRETIANNNSNNKNHVKKKDESHSLALIFSFILRFIREQWNEKNIEKKKLFMFGHFDQVISIGHDTFDDDLGRRSVTLLLPTIFISQFLFRSFVRSFWRDLHWIEVHLKFFNCQFYFDASEAIKFFWFLLLVK